MNARRQHILDILQRHQEVSVRELAERFRVSAMTIRRDLEYLEDRQALTRTHGGAMSSRPAVIEFNFLERNLDCLAEKQAIARRLAGCLAPEMTLILDTGTTTLEVARALVGLPHLRVLTSSLAVASVLYPYEHIELILLGGHVRHNSPDLTGPLTEDNLGAFRADAAILGADAVDPQGLFTADMHVARVSRAMIANAAESWLVADSSKFTRRAFVKFADWPDIDHLVTDNGLAGDDREWLAARGVDVRVAEA